MYFFNSPPVAPLSVVCRRCQEISPLPVQELMDEVVCLSRTRRSRFSSAKERLLMQGCSSTSHA